MIGRSLGGVCPTMSSSSARSASRPSAPGSTASAEGQPVRVNLLGSDVLVIDRSDYGPFRTRQIPYLFFTTGENPLYHSPRDVAATLDYPKLAAISRIMNGVVGAAAEASSVPGWSAHPDYPVAEAAAFRSRLRDLLDHRDDLKIGAYQATLIEPAIRTAEAVTREDR